MGEASTESTYKVAVESRHADLTLVMNGGDNTGQTDVV